MILASAVSVLTLYFAFLLGISGLAKIDHPLAEQNDISFQTGLIRWFFSPITSRALGAFEIVLAFLLAFGIRIELVAKVNAGLFGLFLLFKLFLMLTRQGSRCGCFGAYELSAIDPPSVIASTLILGLAVILAVLAPRPSAAALNWVTAIIFSTAFGWIVFKILRRRLDNKRIRRTSAGAFT